MAGLLSLGLNALTTHSLSIPWVNGSGEPAPCDICCVPSPEGLGLAPVGKWKDRELRLHLLSSSQVEGSIYKELRLFLQMCFCGELGMLVTAWKGELAGGTRLGTFPVPDSHASINY